MIRWEDSAEPTVPHLFTYSLISRILALQRVFRFVKTTDKKTTQQAQ
jgi:hypothetical protein